MRRPWVHILAGILLLGFLVEIFFISFLAGTGSFDISGQVADTVGGVLGVGSFTLVAYQLAMDLRDRRPAKRVGTTVKSHTTAEVPETIEHLPISASRSRKYRNQPPWPPIAVAALTGSLALILAAIPNSRLLLPGFPATRATCSHVSGVLADGLTLELRFGPVVGGAYPYALSMNVADHSATIAYAYFPDRPPAEQYRFSGGDDWLPYGVRLGPPLTETQVVRLEMRPPTFFLNEGDLKPGDSYAVTADVSWTSESSRYGGLGELRSVSCGEYTYRP